jgi:DNA-binding CsgD family transcriptional regulator/tetratricopeptide (TPR) repeat protein
VVEQRTVSGHRTQVSPPAFVGRDRELAALRETLGAAPALVTVEGEAGVGKSRLLRELLASPGGVSGRTLLAACPPFRAPFTLGPVVDAVREVAADGVAGLALSGLGGALRSLFPEWADDLPGPLEPAEDASAARHRLFRALAELLARLDVSVVVVDDLHWADDATLEFLLFLMSHRSQRVSLVVLYRPEDVPADSLLPRLATPRHGDVTRLRMTLRPLDLADTARLMSSMLAGEPISAGFASLVHRHTEGLPLAVEESVRLMSDRTDLTWRRGEWVRRRLEAIHVPPTVRDAVLERTHRLGPQTQAILRAAAVLADPADAPTLAEVAEVTPEQARDGVAEALGRGLLEEQRSSGLVAFRHALAERAVYDAIPPPDRQALHQRAGTVLESRPKPPAARLARHFKESGRLERWMTYAERAADDATARGDGAAATAFLQDLLVGADLPPAAVAPLAAKIPPGSLSGASPIRDILRTFESALASKSLDAEQAAMTRYQMCIVLDSIDAFDESRRAMELAVPDLPDGSLERLRGMVMLGWARGSECPGRVHREWLRRAAEAARSVPGADEPNVTEEIAIALLLLDEPEGWELAYSIPDDVSTPAQRYNVTRRDVNMADLATRWGRYAEARERATSALELAERYGYTRCRELTCATLLQLDWFTGGWDGLADRAAELADDEDTLPVNRLQASLVAALLRAVDGRRDEIDEVFARVFAQMQALGAVEFMVQPAAALARSHLAAGRAEEALRATEESIGVVANKETWLWVTDLAPARVDALVATGRIADAAELVTAFGAGVRGRDAPAPRAALSLCRGILCAARGQHARAAALFARSAAAWERLPRPYDALLARERQAGSLHADGGEEAAIALLERVCQGLSELGARGDAARVTHTLRGHGVDARPVSRWSRRGYGDRLSPREVDVARLIVAGRTNREIAKELFVSPKTVARHVDSAMRKTGVASRTALAVKVLEDGVVTAPDAITQ